VAESLGCKAAYRLSRNKKEGCITYADAIKQHPDAQVIINTTPVGMYPKIGVSPIEYRNELRFAKAEQLYQSGNSIKEIAEAVGFCDEVFFSKLYKKRFGTSMKKRLKTV
jgi:shikimate dehydrogenase